ncbi:MAG: 4-oxalomesaconate tautomerase [Chloroflexota bacterium]
MNQTAIPCVFMRGGTSRGPYFKLDDLPADPAVRDAVLLRVMGSPDIKQIDGIGGSTTVTSKVAIVSKSDHPKADIDYLFAQVSIDESVVDTGPTCGNMLSGVGPFAIEEGLFPAEDGETRIMIRNVNTNSFIEATIQTPERKVAVEGATVIDGVPGTGAAIPLKFFNITGAKTGQLLPTGNVRDTFDGVEVTCIDVAMPMVIALAKDLSKTGYETRAELEADQPFLDRIEAIRRQAGEAMGFGDVSESVVPKFAMVASPETGGVGGHFASRYFTQYGKCHPSYAVSGSICASSASALPGSTLNEVVQVDDRYPELVQIEHPSGVIDVAMDLKVENGQLEVISGGSIRTARRLFSGDVYIPASVWTP